MAARAQATCRVGRRRSGEGEGVADAAQIRDCCLERCGRIRDERRIVEGFQRGDGEFA